MLSLEEYRKLANDEIAAIPYPATPNGLYEPIAYTMDLGGKRLRPALVSLLWVWNFSTISPFFTTM